MKGGRRRVPLVAPRRSWIARTLRRLAESAERRDRARGAAQASPGPSRRASSWRFVATAGSAATWALAGLRIAAVRIGRLSRLALLRLVAVVGLAASALLAADVVRPGRRFCPVEEACDAASASALGSVLGVPTSILGTIAFAGLLVLTFLPRLARLLRPAGVVAALAGLGLFAFQVFALDAFCPWCVVADTMGVVAGAAVLAGRPLALRRARPGQWIPWGAVAVVALAAPVAWPREDRPSWRALDSAGAASSMTTTRIREQDPYAAPAPPRISVVEYLNPFCAHCRATHGRLAAALQGVSTPVRRERLYVWGSKPPPLWAKACVCAQDQGGGVDLERPFFRELLKAPNQSPAAIWAAAERAGLDVAALQACVARGDADQRLGWVRGRVQAARVAGLPTLDIGARRLEGEQSEAELREAVLAAEAALFPTGRPDGSGAPVAERRGADRGP